MNLFKNVPIFFKHQTINFFRFLLKKPLTYPSLGSITLDKDDVEIAEKLINNRNSWRNLNIVKDYEEQFAKWNQSKYAHAFMGGRVALSACIYALNLQKDDEVILPGYTCVVVPNAFHYANVKIIFSDIELETYGLDAAQIIEKITPQTKAILIQHLYGLVCRDYEKIIQIAHDHNIKVIEDCAHSTGALFKGEKVGNFGDIAFYSSEQSKIFTTIQGGIATTNDKDLNDRLIEFCNKTPYPDNNWIDKQLHNIILNYYNFKHPKRWLLGDIYNILYGDKQLISTTCEEENGICPTYYFRKMPPPIAAIGINQLKKIDSYNEKRRKTAEGWDKWCDIMGYKKPLVIEDSVPVFLRYPILVEPIKKDNLSWAKKELNIRPGVWFVTNIHPAPSYVINCPNADKAVRQCINFPTIIDNFDNNCFSF